MQGLRTSLQRLLQVCQSHAHVVSWPAGLCCVLKTSKSNKYKTLMPHRPLHQYVALWLVRRTHHEM